ncbi:histidine kinase 3 [Tanacetum coccineum]
MTEFAIRGKEPKDEVHMVLHLEREYFEKQEGWTIKKTTPADKDEYNLYELEPSPIQQEYALVISLSYKLAQETQTAGREDKPPIANMFSDENRKNVMRVRELRKGVLTAPFELIKTNRLGVILTFAMYKRDLPSNATLEKELKQLMGILVESLISNRWYYKDDSWWSEDLKSKTTEDIISIGSFVEVLVLNQYSGSEEHCNKGHKMVVLSSVGKIIAQRPLVVCGSTESGLARRERTETDIELELQASQQFFAAKPSQTALN